MNRILRVLLGVFLTLWLTSTAEAQVCPRGAFCFYVPPGMPLNGSHSGGGTGHVFDVIISSPTGAVTGTYSIDGAASTAFSASPGAPYRIEMRGNNADTSIPHVLAGFNTAATRGVYIVATSPDLTIDHREVFDSEQYSETIKRHSISLGQRFRLAGYSLNNEGIAQANRDVVLITAPTGATVTLTAPPGASQSPFWDGGTGNTISRTLTAGQSIAFRTAGGWDMDGALLTADDNITVSTGGRGWSTSGCGDDGMDALLPVAFWGSSFVTRGPSGSSNVNAETRIRVIADTDGTQVFINGSSTAAATLNGGQFYTLSAGETTGITRISTSNPSMVWLNGGRDGCELDTVFVPPIYFQSSLTALSADFQILGSSELQMILPTSAVSSIRFNGAAPTFTTNQALTGVTGPNNEPLSFLAFSPTSSTTSTVNAQVVASADFQLLLASRTPPSGLLGYYNPFRLPGCGDGRITGAESCDDGNLIDGDGCNATCRREVGVSCAVTPECGAGLACNPTSLVCVSACNSAADCGDGNPCTTDVCEASGICSNPAGNAGAVCSIGRCAAGACAPFCSDGIVAAPETCDDSNVTPGDGCNTNCRREVTIAAISPNPTSNSRPTFTGTADVGASVVLTIDGQMQTVVANASGVWSYTPASAISDGARTLTALATDTGGGTSTASRPITVDTRTNVTLAAPGNGAVINQSRPTLTGTAEAGATVEVILNNVSRGTVVVGGAGTWSFPLTTNLADGTVSVSLRASDALGNTANATSSFVIDTTTTVAITAPASSATLDTTRPTISGTGEVGAAISVTLNGGAPLTTTVAADGTWSVTPVAALPNGPLSISVSAVDALGNTATATSSATIAASTFIVIDLPTEGTTTADTTPTFTGTGEPGATISIIVDGGALGTAMVLGDGSWSFTPSAPLAEGARSLRAVATDPSGNTAEASRGFAIDASTHVDFLQPGDQGPIGEVRPTLSGTAEPGASVAVTLDSAVIGTVTADAEGNWSILVPSALAAGGHAVSVTATDALANTATDTGNFTIDIALPSLDIVTPADQSRTTDTTPTISGTATPGVTVRVTIDSVVVGSVQASANGSWSVDVATALDLGPHIVIATTTNAAAQTVTDQHGFEVVSGTAPEVSITAPTSGLVTGDSTPTLSGTATPGATVQVFVDGVLVGTPAVDGSGLWTIDVATALDAGDHVVRAVALNTAGLTSTASADFVVDLATFVNILLPADGGTVGSRRPTLSGDAEPGDTVTVELDGQTIGTVMAAADGTWSITPTADITAGSHDIHVVAVDASSNSATDDSSFTYDPSMLDSDGDGQTDAEECPSSPCRDTDGDGITDELDADDDGDGVPTAIECATRPCRDTDGDDTPDFLDTDDDGDGVLTRDERPADVSIDSDGDNTPDFLDTDDDGDGIPTADELGTGATPRDSDGDGRPDFRDADDDNDTISTARERADGLMFGNDVDGDGIPNHLDTDSDGAQGDDASEGTGDSDGDGIPNYLDPTENVRDGGVVDAGVRADAGAARTDAGAPDGGVGGDAGAGVPGGISGGAFCAARPGSTGRGAIGWLMVIGAALLAARRRR